MTVLRRDLTELRTPRTTGILGELAIEPPAWMTNALCAQIDNEIFFPEKGGSTREAKAICAVCPVAAECLDYALEHEERFGIWGGLSERERRKIAAALGKPNTANVRKTHCVNGHEFTEANTYLRPDGGRTCRTCAANAQRNFKENHR